MDYTDYLDGYEWPSASRTARSSSYDDPIVVAVEDMPPQYAAGALAKLIRWAREGFLTEDLMEEAEVEIRCTTLARALDARATSRNDFVFPDEATALDESGVAAALAISIVTQADEDVVKSDQLGELCTKVAKDLIRRRIVMYRR